MKGRDLMYRLLALTTAIAMGLTACAGKVDRFGVDRVLDRGLRVPDLGMVCTMGEAMVHPLSAITSSRNPAHKALLISETISGTCTQQTAWEAETQTLSVRHNLQALLPADLLDPLRGALLELGEALGL